jgi:hypothetical protein
MKRTDLLRHLRRAGCIFIREGSRHSMWLNPGIGRSVPVPRHRELDNFLIRKICKELEVPAP